VDFSKLDTSRIGVIWGSGIGGLKTFLDEVTAFAKGDGTPRFNPFFIPKMIADIAPGHISIKYGLRGPNFTTVSACASSNNSLIDAFNYIRLGKANMFISGGSLKRLLTKPVSVVLMPCTPYQPVTMTLQPHRGRLTLTATAL
jgi:3-oxoacyl-[acyl-carrier-protein] synthase II